MITSKLKTALLVMVFILGCTNLAYELIILRQLVNFVGSNTILTSVVIAFILLFLSLGYYVGSVISVAKFSIRKICLRLMFVLTIWYVISCSYFTMSLFFVAAAKITMQLLALIFAFSFVNLIVPSTIAGIVTALVGRIIHRADSNYTGRFMAVDTVGSVLGSLGTTLILMPFIGVSKTIFVMAVISALTMIIIARKRQMMTWAICFGWLVFVSYVINYMNFFVKESSLVKDDAVSRLEIVKYPDDSKIMFINGQLASKFAKDENDFFEYVKFINRNIIDTLPQDKVSKILVLGAGGFTVGINDERNIYTYLDIEKNLQQISEEKFLEEKLTANKKFIFTDAYVYMLQNKEKYDVIVLDVYSSVHSMPINFVTAEFLNIIKEHLAENGVLAANIVTDATFNNKFSKRLDNTFRYVFNRNLSRQVIQDFNPFESGLSNVIYTYYNRSEEEEIYTADKNSAMYGQY